MTIQRRIQRKIDRVHSAVNRAEEMRRERLYMPFSQFVILMPYMTVESVKSLVLIPPPKVFCKRNIPDTLQMATFGKLTELQNAAQSKDYLNTCARLVEILTGVPAERVKSRPAIEVLGIVNMVQSEMERIGKLFQTLTAEHTSDELNAGIERLNFGTFGIVDWYAKRMGIVDHEEVFATPWARIYQCMKIDHENNEFEKRYRKIIERRTLKK